MHSSVFFLQVSWSTMYKSVSDLRKVMLETVTDVFQIEKVQVCIDNPLSQNWHANTRTVREKVKNITIYSQRTHEGYI